MSWINWLLDVKDYHLAARYAGIDPVTNKLLAGTNLLIFLVHFVLALMLLTFVIKKPEYYRSNKHRWIGWLFAFFVLFTGGTHLVRAITYYVPLYNLLLAVNIATVIIAWTLVWMSIPLMLAKDESIRQIDTVKLYEEVQHLRKELAEREARLNELISSLKSLPEIKRAT